MFRISSNFQKVQNELDVNGFLRLNMTQMEILNDINIDLLPRVILRKTTCKTREISISGKMAKS